MPRTANTTVRAYRGYIRLSGTLTPATVRVWYYARTLKAAQLMHLAHGMTYSDLLHWDRDVNLFAAGTVILAKNHEPEATHW